LLEAKNFLKKSKEGVNVLDIFSNPKVEFMWPTWSVLECACFYDCYSFWSRPQKQVVRVHSKNKFFFGTYYNLHFNCRITKSNIKLFFFWVANTYFFSTQKSHCFPNFPKYLVIFPILSTFTSIWSSHLSLFCFCLPLIFLPSDLTTSSRFFISCIQYMLSFKPHFTLCMKRTQTP